MGVSCSRAPAPALPVALKAAAFSEPAALSLADPTTASPAASAAAAAAQLADPMPLAVLTSDTRPLLAETAGPETSERWRPGHRRESLGKKNRFVTLTITIHGARNLLAKDSNGLSDPYALITFGKMEYKTRVIQCTLNPVWEETRTFTLYQVESAHPNVIHVLLFDDDTIQHTPLTRSSNRADVGDDDFLGHVEIELPVVGGSSRAWYLLRQRSHRSHVAGEVEISIALTSVELDYNRLAKPRPGTGTVIDTRAFHSASQQRAREARPRPWPLPGDVDAGVVASCLVQAQLGTDVVWPWYKLVMYDEYAVLRIDDSTPPSFLVVLALVLVDGVRQLDGGFLSLPIHGMRSRGGSLKLRFASDAVASEWAERFQSARPLHRYGSRYAPAACPAEDVALFGCGSEYFASLVDAVVGAQRFICIADWYLSPEVYLKRDVLPLDARYRLDNLLRSKAEQGVQVFVLCFDDHNMIGLASERVVKTFNLLHRNVHCMRHGPTEIKDAYFSHHQKFVIVDGTTCFVGGIDLCFGRYDEPNHPVVDAAFPFVWPGADYYNPRAVANDQLDRPFVERADRSCQPRMPWQDAHAKLTGEVAYSLTLLFMQRWTHHRFQLDAKARKRVPLFVPPPKASLLTAWPTEMAPGGCSAQLLCSMSEWSGSPTLDRSIHTAMLDLIARAKKYIYIEQQFFISSADDEMRSLPVNSRLDVLAAPLYNSFKSLSRAGRSAVRKSNGVLRKISSKSSTNDNDDDGGGGNDGNDGWGDDGGASRTTDAADGNEDDAALSGLSPRHNGNHHTLIERAKERIVEFEEKRPHLRANMRKLMRSKNNDALTRESVHRTTIYNKVGKALFDRISRAIEEGEEFRVIVVLPDYPEGHYEREKYSQAVMHYQSHALCLGKDSLLGRLIATYPHVDMSQIVQFSSLRSYGFCGVVPMQENVYVHSKLMLVDDEHALVGSANINDRSLLGFRDSECSVLLENAADKVGAFRKLLWSRHLGLDLGSDVGLLNDVPQCYKEWQQRALANTAIFEKVWPDCPSSRHTTLASIAAAAKGPLDPGKLSMVKGFVVDHPKFFLAEEQDLLPPISRREGALVDYSMFQ